MATRKKKTAVLDPDDLRAVFSSMAEGLVVVNTKQRVEALNQMGGVLLRIAPMQAQGMPIQNLFELYHVEHGEKTPWPVERILKLDITRVRIWDHIYCKNKIGGLFPITIVVTPLLTDRAVSGAVILFRDATEEVRTDEAKSDFVAVVSHQLQTPLTAIKLFTEILDEEPPVPNAQRKEYLGLLRSSVERMIKLVNEMLNVSRLEAGALRIDPADTDFKKFIKDALKELEPVAKTHACELIFREPAESFGSLPLDTSLLTQVLFNLVENGMRYSKGPACRVMVDIGVDAKAEEFVLRIEDNGIGITSEDQKRLFTKFFRADNARKVQSNGSGLGLYVVKMIVEAWGGKIWLTSKAGSGTTFFVTIPQGGMKPRKSAKQLIKN